MKKRILLFLLLFTSLAFAITEQEFAAASAFWQRLWNQGQLYPAPFTANGDLDGDGRSNYLEYLAGTDPKSGTPPAGIAVLQISHTPATFLNSSPPQLLTPETASLTWQSVAGKAYQLWVSPDLSANSWTAIGEPLTGDGHPLGKAIVLTQPDGSTPPKLFFRLEIGDTPSSLPGSPRTASQDYILALHPEFANPTTPGGNPGTGNPNPPAEEEDYILRSANGGELAKWKKTPELGYMWLPVENPPAGYRAISVNNKGQILFENSALLKGEYDIPTGFQTWPNELATTPVGKIWDPARPAANRWTDVFFKPSPFTIQVIRSTPAPPPVSVIISNNTASLPAPTNADLEQYWQIALHSIGDDGSVMSNVYLGYSKWDGPGTNVPHEWSTGSPLVFLWSGSNHSSCQLLGGGDRGSRPYSSAPAVINSWTANGAAGFWTDGNNITRAVIHDQDKNSRWYSTTNSSDARANHYTITYPLPMGPSNPPVTSLVAPRRINSYSPSEEAPRRFTHTGRLALSDFNEDPDGEAFNSVIFGAGGETKLNLSGDFNLFDLPDGGVALGGKDLNLQVISGGDAKATSLSGITEFDKLGTGIGAARGIYQGHQAGPLPDPAKAIWRNGEWSSIKDLTGITDFPANVDPQRITTNGIIWAGDVLEKNGILIPVEVSWKAVEGLANIDDHIDPWTHQINGKRIFPDFKDPDATEIRHKVEVIVKTSPALVGKPVFVKAFDVDDTTDEDFDLDEDGTIVIDTNGAAGGDNKPDYLNTPANGQFWTNGAWGGQTAESVVDGNGEAKFIFQVGMQPGNNYRVVASVLTESMYQGVQTNDPAAAKYLGTEFKQNGVAAASPLLTVWRRLWVENDSMEQIPVLNGNKLNDLKNGNNILREFYRDSTQTSFGIDPVYDTSSFSKLEKGRIVIQGHSYDVVRTGPSPPPNLRLTNAVTVLGNHSEVPIDSVFYLYDDDDHGLSEEPLPRQDLADDQMKSYFKSAFIEVTSAASYNSPDHVAFHANENIANPSTVVISERNLSDKKELWVCGITAAYQGPHAEDNDPVTEDSIGESLLFGETASYGQNDNFDHSTVFVEACREAYFNSFESRDPNMLTLARSRLRRWMVAVAAHEMGHQPKEQSADQDHEEHNLMSASMADVSSINPENAKFTAPSVLRFRTTDRWSK